MTRKRDRANKRRYLIPLAAVLVLALFFAARALLRRPQEQVRATLTLAGTVGGTDTIGYRRAVGPHAFSFPRDHGPHPGFRTEWWYFTGNLEDASGRRFGYQFTIFRSALHPPDSATARDTSGNARSDWRADDIYMAHFTVTDAKEGHFIARDRFARAALGLAGAQAQPLRVWLEDWRVESTGESAFPVRLVAFADSIAIDLVLDQGKPVVLNGVNGLSQKSAAPGNASYYYALTRMPTRGTVTIAGRSAKVSGFSWLDREWSTSALAPGVVGWDWFSIQLSDDTELMVYRLRRADGSTDPFSGGTFISKTGEPIILSAEDIVLEQRSAWRSPLDGTMYPARWRIAVPHLGIRLETEPVLPDQELNVAVRYWEGAIVARGTSHGQAVTGRGYMELTGYGPEGAAAAEAPRRQ